MNPALARDIAINAAVITVYAVAGVLALVAAYRWRESRGRVPALLLAWAMLQHAGNVATASDPIQQAFGVPGAVARWTGLISGYFVAVPWAMLLERVLGVGWRASIRRTWQVYLAVAMGCIAYDVWTDTLGAAADVNRVVVGAGAFVGFANLSFARQGMPQRVLVLRIGLLVFLGLVVHDALAGAGLLPWDAQSGPLSVLIGISAIAYTAVTRTLQGQRELRAMAHELATARRIQFSLLPQTAPALDGAALVFRYVPAAAVAGDVFDFLGATSRQVGILVADVSGHGVPAALIASMVKVAAAAQKPHASDPARVLQGIHLAIADELPRAHFVTVSYVFVDLDRRLMRHASAGHPPPLVWRAATRDFAQPAETGPLIIDFAAAAYPVTEMALAPGDRVIVYTDGIPEAMRPDGEMFGLERLREIAARSAEGAEALAAAIITAAVTFRGRRAEGLEDDCTLVVLEVQR